MTEEFNKDIDRLRREDYDTFKEWCQFSWSVTWRETRDQETLGGGGSGE